MSTHIKPRAIFPGRETIYLREVARFIGKSEQEVADLIDAGQLRAVDIVTISGGKRRTSSPPNLNELRVPIEALEDYLKANREKEPKA